MRRMDAALLLACLSTFLLSYGCLSAIQEAPRGDHILQLVHSSGGDAPIVTFLTVYDKEIALEELGRSEKRRQIEDEKVEIIRSLLQGTDLRKLSEVKIDSAHEEVVWLDFGGARVSFPTNQIPPEVGPLINSLERLFSANFKSYKLGLAQAVAIASQAGSTSAAAKVEQ